MDETEKGFHLIERMSNEMADITVIIPVYNAERYLRNCIDSIMSQTVPAKEIILVDDGSADESAEICDQYAREMDNITVIHQINSGVSSARYKGLLNANTRYVLYVDSDDFIRHDLIEKILPYMKKGIDIISFSKTNYYDETYQRRGKMLIPSGYYDRKLLEEKVYPVMLWDATRHVCGLDASLCNKAIKKELFGDNLKDISKLGIHYGEDVGTVYFIILVYWHIDIWTYHLHPEHQSSG